jgi:hypothetical protein
MKEPLLLRKSNYPFLHPVMAARGVDGEQGLLFTEAAYLKSGWNLVDFLVLGAAWASFGAERQGIDLSGGSLFKV